MAKKRETRRVDRIKKTLKREFGIDIWFFKVWGGPFQSSGIPDLVGCCKGLFFALEVKEPDGGADELQIETIADINQAGGLAAFIVEPEEAVELLRDALAGTRSSGRTNFKLRSNSRIRRTKNR